MSIPYTVTFVTMVTTKTAPVPHGTGAVFISIRAGEDTGAPGYFTVMLMILSSLTIFFTTSIPLMTLPKTAYWPSRAGCGAGVM
jgi:hypothetical protein